MGRGIGVMGPSQGAVAEGQHRAPGAAPHVALLGGSFDPVHWGHVRLAQAALALPDIDELWWLPAGQPWQKSRALASAEHRLAMLNLVVQGHDPRQRVETCEIDRAGPTYTIDTLEQLSQSHPGVRWSLVIGFDQLRGLPSWRRWQDLLQRVEFLVAVRPGTVGWEAALPDGLQGALQGARIRPLDMPPQDVSSTAIREGARRGEPLEGYVPEAVARYIAQHGLYR